MNGVSALVTRGLFVCIVDNTHRASVYFSLTGDELSAPDGSSSGTHEERNREVQKVFVQGRNCFGAGVYPWMKAFAVRGRNGDK